MSGAWPRKSRFSWFLDIFVKLENYEIFGLNTWNFDIFWFWRPCRGLPRLERRVAPKQIFHMIRRAFLSSKSNTGAGELWFKMAGEVVLFFMKAAMRCAAHIVHFENKTSSVVTLYSEYDSLWAHNFERACWYLRHCLRQFQRNYLSFFCVSVYLFSNNMKLRRRVACR